jgi:hypothetical protein
MNPSQKTDSQSEANIWDVMKEECRMNWNNRGD